MISTPHRPHAEHKVPVARGRVLGAAELGDPRGFPVLWFHGTPGGRLQLPPDAHTAAEARGLRLFGVERPGTGFSTPHRYPNVRAFGDDIRAFADALGLARIAVVGLSGGGPYTLATAHAMPSRVVAAAVLGGIGPTVGSEAVPSYTRALRLVHPLARVAPDALGRVLPRLLAPVVPHARTAVKAFAAVTPAADKAILLDPAFQSVLVGDLVHVMPDGLGAPVQDARLFSSDWGFRIAEVQVPVHFYQGDADTIVPASHGHHQAKLVRRSQLTIVEGGGHLAGYVNAGRVFDWLLPHVHEAR